MGIKGLWNLLKPVGQPINLENLRGKVLAIDISFWLHHAKYVSELRGISEHSAAVELVYRRILKLLHFGIKPIFVFDGPEASILKLPTLIERKKQREHQAGEKAKRSQNRTLKTLARKALAVQLARNEGRRQHQKSDQDNDGEIEQSSSSSSQELIELISDDDSDDDGIEEIDETPYPAIFDQLTQDDEGSSSSQKTVNIIYSGSNHAHVLIRSETIDESLLNEQKERGGFIEDFVRRKEAVEKVRGLAASDHLSTSNQQKRNALLPTRLDTYEDEKRLSGSSDEEFEEVPDVLIMPTFSTKTSNGNHHHHVDKERPNEDLSSTSTADIQKPNVEEPEKTIVEKWGARREENDERNEKSSGGEIAERVRELLTYFGVPYVDAPGEAEAQCVALEQYGLTDGTISDDSDVWALGGQIIYRHVFDRKKSALEFRANDISKTFGLEQLHFVALASILGCDFTPGIVNVGIVSALEILSTFIDDRSSKNEKLFINKLAKFRRWWEKNHVEDGQPEAPEPNATKRRIRKLNCIFPSIFPDRTVFELFTKPKVQEIFTNSNGKSIIDWSQPDVDNLRRLLTELLPDTKQVDMELADLRRRLKPPDPSQAKLTSYFANVKKKPSSTEIFETSSSKRLKNACEKLKKTGQCE